MSHESSEQSLEFEESASNNVDGKDRKYSNNSNVYCAALVARIQVTDYYLFIIQ